MLGGPGVGVAGVVVTIQAIIFLVACFSARAICSTGLNSFFWSLDSEAVNITLPRSLVSLSLIIVWQLQGMQRTFQVFDK